MRIIPIIILLTIPFLMNAQKEYNIEFVLNDKNLVQIAPRVYMSQSPIVNLKFRESKKAKGVAKILTIYNSAAPEAEYDITYSAKDDLYSAEIRLSEKAESIISIIPTTARKDIVYESVTIFYLEEGFAPILEDKLDSNIDNLSIILTNPKEEYPTVYQEKITLEFFIRTYNPGQIYRPNVVNLSDKNSESEVRNLGNGLFECDIKLNRSINQIIISVESDSQHGSTRLIINYKQNDFTRNGCDRALLIAVEDYDHPKWQSLERPASDVNKLADVLENKFGFTTELLTNPTLNEIKAKIKEYAEKEYAEHDQLLVFFSGHGKGDNVFTSGYFAARDSDPINDPNHNTFYGYNEMKGNINDIGCQKILLMIDACYSGKLHKRLYKGSSKKIRNRDRKEEIFNQMELRTRIAITATGENREAVDGEFATQFLEALNQPAQLGIINLDHIMAKLGNMDPKPIRDNFASQDHGADFFFILNKY